MTVLGRSALQISRVINRSHRCGKGCIVVSTQSSQVYGTGRRSNLAFTSAVRAQSTAAGSSIVEPIEPPKKGIFTKLWDRYSISGQQKRIELGERLFRAAQWRAMNPSWFGKDKVSSDFRPQHALITMHVWFLHRRLIADKTDPHFSLLVQEELFDILWNDTRSRIRAAGVHELTVNKHLKDAQQSSFLQCTQYDHAFSEFKDDPEERFQVICNAAWRHILAGEEDANEQMIRRLGAYVEYQMSNILLTLPDDYFFEGRIDWGSMPEFDSFAQDDASFEEDNSVRAIKFDPSSSWVQVLTDAGEPYYWNTDSDQTSWEKPNA